jgi:SNF2 family DNA or RNA helicase
MNIIQSFLNFFIVYMPIIIFLYRFISEETIEQQIKKLQTHKMALASSVLTGTRHHGANKLSLDDLKMLFNFRAPT